MLVSAITREGLPELLNEIGHRLSALSQEVSLALPAHAGRLMNWLYENTTVVERSVDDAGTTQFKIRIDPRLRGRLDAQLRDADVPTVV
jgi:50S ribosomal subunit-associated GTPase HflX